MPANKEYLTHGTAERIGKVSAALVGSFLVAVSSMLALASWSDRPSVVFMSYTYLLILVWCALMLVAFLFRKAWKCWLLYASLVVIFITFFLIGR